MGGTQSSQFEILLNVYDLHEANGFLQHIGIGLYHTGVEIAGKEYFFTPNGVFSSRPKYAPGSTFKKSISFGFLKGNYNNLNIIMSKVKEQFPPGSYDLLEKNCNHFTDALCRALTGKGIPSWINRAASVGRVLRFSPSQDKKNFDGVVPPLQTVVQW